MRQCCFSSCAPRQASWPPARPLRRESVRAGRQRGLVHEPSAVLIVRCQCAAGPGHVRRLWPWVRGAFFTAAWGSCRWRAAIRRSAIAHLNIMPIVEVLMTTNAPPSVCVVNSMQPPVNPSAAKDAGGARAISNRPPSPGRRDLHQRLSSSAIMVSSDALSAGCIVRIRESTK